MKKLKGAMRPMTFLLKQMLKYPGLMVLTSVTLVAASATNVIIPYLTKPLINDYILKGDVPGIIKMLILLGIMYAISLLSSWGSSRILVRLSQRVTQKLRSDVFSKMQELPMSYFDKRTHGELMSIYTNDLDTVSNFISSSISNIITAFLTFAGIMGTMIFLSPPLALVSAVFLAAQYITMKKSGGLSRKYFVNQQAELAGLNGYIEEMTEGQKVIKVFSHEDSAVMGFRERNDRLLEASVKAQTYSGVINPALGGIAELNNAATSSVGVVLVILGYFDVGSLVAYIQLVQKAGHQIGAFSSLINVVLAAVAGTERVMELLDLENEPDSGRVRLEGGDWVTPDGSRSPLEGRIDFENVSFSYVPNQQVLNDVSLSARPNKKIALVGATGAGKTTITNLLNRFYEITEGSISFDGFDLRDIRKDDLRSSVAMVLQDTHLFTDTVRENIRFGRLDATDEDVEAAAMLAGADFFISHLPQGYDTLLSDDGGSLSQGQRQLVAIARAAVADPAVIVLDEATSSIDTRTEKIIEAGMDRLMKGRTVFIIAHRLSTVRDCDEILVMDFGRIIERGTHQELIGFEGVYHSLYTGKLELE